MVGRLLQYLRLMRPYGMLFLGLAPVFGAVANQVANGLVLWELLLFGLLYHVFTFVHNDIVDMEVDARSRYVAARPLLAGAVPRGHAVVLVLGALIGVLVLAVLSASVLTAVLALAALGCAAAYNLWSKRSAFLEYLLGLGVFFLVLAGAVVVTPQVSVLAWVVAGAFFSQWVFSVGVAANLKDIEEDTKNGVFTSPTVFGVRFTSGRIVIPRGFQAYAGLVSLAYIMVLGLPLALGIIPGNVWISVEWVGFVALSFALLVTTAGVLRGPSPSRDRFLRYAGVHEGLALLLVPMMLLTLLMENVGFYWTLVLLMVIVAWPLCWFRILFGKRLLPLE
jgi:4-hydroxybenzoate polyprenyltransferase